MRRFRARLWLLGDFARTRSFTVIAMALVSPSSPATSSRSTALSPSMRGLSTPSEGLPSGRSRSRPRSSFMRAAFRAAIERGDLTFACYGMIQSVTGLFLRNDPLDAVWRESEMALDFAREAKSRRRGHHREPATLHRDHARPNRELLRRLATRNSTRRRSRHS